MSVHKRLRVDVRVRYRQGMECGAEPQHRLQCRFREFQRRMAKRAAREGSWNEVYNGESHPKLSWAIAISLLVIAFLTDRHKKQDPSAQAQLLVLIGVDFGMNGSKFLLPGCGTPFALAHCH